MFKISRLGKFFISKLMISLSPSVHYYLSFVHLIFILNLEASCVRGLNLWRNSSSEINDELYKGYRKGNSERKINEIVAGWCPGYSLHVLCCYLRE